MPEWVTYEDDTTVPDEEELKEIQGTDADVSARDVSAMEKRLYSDVGDPDQRPVKKLRLSWVIKGVRGTKERPNYARVINSPPALVDGLYWHVKFFPRGNKCSALSAYIKCSKTPPPPDVDFPESTFSIYEGAPDADLGESAEPRFKVSTPASTPRPKEEVRQDEEEGGQKAKKRHADEPTTPTGHVIASPGVDENAVRPEHQTSTTDADWRVSAQLGMVIYNPAEPRTHHAESSEHQFNRHNDDWGWTDLVRPWNEVHLRRRGQRQALLCNDTIVLDAYIRIFDDPSQALWWHSCDGESQWDSKLLTGYFPMGTPPLYHSPAVAGITALVLLEPFRRVIESLDVSQWRKHPDSRPRPFLCQLQMMLYLMRTMKGDTYVNVYPIILELSSVGEHWCDVKSFWEVFLRAIDLELDEHQQSAEAIRQIFGGLSHSASSNLPPLPVQGVKDVQEGLDQVLSTLAFDGQFPDFLPLTLDRQKFDPESREWKMFHDRVRLNEEIDVCGRSASSTAAKYTLYGFMVHVGERNSGKFFTVLRPDGPGTKWLAFEDGDGNKVFSYTKRRIQDFEGLEGEELKNFKSTRQTAYLVMYIRTSVLAEYLPGKLGPYNLLPWMKPYLESPWKGDNNKLELETVDENADVDIRLYSDASIRGREGLLDMFNIKDLPPPSSQHVQYRSVAPRTIFKELRSQLAAAMNIAEPEKLRLWIMSYGYLGNYNNAQMTPVKLHREIGYVARSVQPLCLWLSVLETDEEVRLFGYPDPPEKKRAQSSSSSVGGAVTQEVPEVAEAEPGIQHDQATVQDDGQGGRSEPDASPDALQESVREAVAFDMTATETSRPIDAMLAVAAEPITPVSLVPDWDVLFPELPADAMAIEHEGQSSVTEVEGSDVSREQPQSAAETTDAEIPLSVEHGHLIDAILHHAAHTTLTVIDDASSPPRIEVVSIANDGQQASAENDALIASMIAADVDHIQILNSIMPQTIRVDIGGNTTDILIPSEGADTPSTPREIANVRPTEHTYGFIQMFDAEAQTFTVHSPYYAEWTSNVKATMRKYLSYADDRDFHVWRRDSGHQVSPVSCDAVFSDLRFSSDGVDMVVGEMLSESQIEALQAQGKFSTPDSLTRYLWFTARKHPIFALTSAEPVEISDFGTDYYRGPLVKGQCHGADCVKIQSNGHTYSGPLVAGKKAGPVGQMTYQNGDVYTGAWRHDERHGQGTFLEKRTGNRYEGGFENGKRWGRGTTYWQVADEEADLCQICYGEEIDALFFDCGHVCACVECARQCDVCPICRRGVRQVVKMFRS